MRKIGISVLALLLSLSLAGCSNTEDNTVQTRSDLTAEHFRGLTGGMKRDDVTGLVGNHDAALSDKEDIHVYNLSDGTKAVLHYQDDVLQSASIRGSDNMEDTIFNNLDRNYQTGSFSGGSGGSGAGGSATGESGGGQSGGAGAGESGGTGTGESGGTGAGESGGAGAGESGGTGAGESGGTGTGESGGTGAGESGGTGTSGTGGAGAGTDGMGSNGSSGGLGSGDAGAGGTGSNGTGGDGSYDTDNGMVDSSESQSN